jgi:hypothetical protein
MRDEILKSSTVVSMLHFLEFGVTAKPRCIGDTATIPSERARDSY